MYFVLKSEGNTDEFMYKAVILGNKQLLSNMIDREAIQVSHTTRIAFLIDCYMFGLNYPAIYCIIQYKSLTT